MPDLNRLHDPRLLLGLLGAAACGPGAPVMTGDGTEGTDTSAGPGTDATDTVDPTVTSEPTGSTTLPPPECQYDGDCAGYCGYCIEGTCQESPGCCGYDGVARAWRCSPPYQCYVDGDCDDGYVCEFGECVPVAIVVLPPCRLEPVVVDSWNLSAPPSGLVLADLDGDLDLDVAAALPGLAGLELALNDGLGNFTLAGSVSVGAPTDQLGLAAGDLDGDGDTDLVAIRGGAPGELALVFGQDAVFMATQVLPAADDPQQAFIADIDGDGVNDILTVHQGIPSVEVRVGEGAGKFADPKDAGVPNALDPRTTVTDFDLDGRTDLVAPITLGTDAGVWLGQADGTLAPVRVFDVGGPDIAAFAGDTELIGLQSIVFARQDGTVRAFPAVQPGVWEVDGQDVAATSPLLGGVMADFDGVNGPDLVSATGTATVAVLLNDGEGSFHCELVQPVDADSARALVVAGDVDGDGRSDLLSASSQSTVVTVVRP